MRLRLGAFLTACLIGLAGCTGGSDDAPKPVATAGPDTGDLMVHGVVTRNDKPVRDAKVWFELWPEPDDTKDGEVVDLWTSRSVTTDGDGRYALRLDPDTLTSRYFGGTFLNFDIHFYRDGKDAMWGSTVHLVRDKVWRSDEEALVGDPVLAMSIDLKASKITLTDSRGDSETSEIQIAALPPGVVPGSG
jgi:hypothetical protein